MMHKTIKRALILFLLAVVVTACYRLDDFMFNAETDIPEYKLDAYEGERELDSLPARYDVPDSLVEIFTLASEGSEIYAVYIGDQKRIATDTVIMYCHGNRDHMDFYWPRAKLLANVGGKNRYGVLMIDYKGFGMSGGKPTEQGLTKDVASGLRWLKDNGLTSDRLVIYGYSLGSAPATDHAAEPSVLKPRILVLESCFASTDVMTQDASGLAMPASFVTNAEYDNAEQIKKVEQPFLWLHGIDDDFLAIDTHGEVVYKNYLGSRSKAVRVEGAVHNDVPKKLGYEEYIGVLADFITR